MRFVLAVIVTCGVLVIAGGVAALPALECPVTLVSERNVCDGDSYCWVIGTEQYYPPNDPADFDQPCHPGDLYISAQTDGQHDPTDIACFIAWASAPHCPETCPEATDYTVLQIHSTNGQCAYCRAYRECALPEPEPKKDPAGS